MRRLNNAAVALLTVLCLALSAIASPARAQPSPVESLNAEDAYRAALDAYLYFYPLITMDLSRRQATNVNAGVAPGRGPANTFVHARNLPTSDYKDVVRPNFDMLRSSAWLDLSGGPVVISVPDTNGRHYVLSLLDMWTDVFAVLGKRTTGTGRANYAVVPPGWTGTLPSSMRRIDATTPMVWVDGLIQTNGPSEYKTVHTLQDGFLITPLAQWNQPSQSFGLKADPTIDMHTPPLEQVDKMSAEAFFTYAAELSRKHPPHATDQPMLARLRRIGINYGQQLNFSKLDYTTQQALRRAVREGRQYMHDKLPTMEREVNGWQMDTSSIGVYGNFYLKRAITARTRLGAPLPEDSVALVLLTDADGEPLDGEHDYVLRFEHDNLPPAGTLWSLSMYDEQGFQSANPLNRYALGDRDPISYNPDGSLELYLQRAAPGPNDQANWLPTPSGPLGVTLRIYTPQPSVLSGEWTPPTVVRRAREPATTSTVQDSL